MKRYFRGWWIAVSVCVLLLPFISIANHRRLNGQLLHIAGEGKSEAVTTLLDKGAEVNTKTIHGYTPLHSAASMSFNTQGDDQDNSSTIKILVARGGNIDAVDDEGSTPLHYAIMSMNAKNVRALIQNGANPNVRSLKWGRPLRQAEIALKQEGSSMWTTHLIKIVRSLKAAGARE